jgi:hypothetical protein
LAVAGLVIVGILSAVACQERKATPALVQSTGDARDVCSGDSLRPAAAAPAEGLWLYEQPNSTTRVAARIGASRPDDRKLVVTRPVEILEITAGDTIRERIDTAMVSLEILPALGRSSLTDGRPDTTLGSNPAATYATSPRIRLAAYEPCITSSSGPRTRYLRRDAAGRIVTDVMLRRESDR